MGLKAQKQHDIKFPDLDSSRTLQPKPRSFLPDCCWILHARAAKPQLQITLWTRASGSRGHSQSPPLGPSVGQAGGHNPGSPWPSRKPFLPPEPASCDRFRGRLPPAGTREKGEVEKAAPLQTPRRASASMVGGLVRRGARPSHCQDVLTQKRPPSPESPSSCPRETETNPGI